VVTGQYEKYNMYMYVCVCVFVRVRVCIYAGVGGW